MRLVVLVLSVIVFVIPTNQAEAATLRSNEYLIQTGIIPTPTPFRSLVQTGFAESQNAKPMRLFISSDLIDYGPITPTNPIKRKLTISLDPGSSYGYKLYVFANHPLSLGDNVIPDIRCDDGSCTEKVASAWINPFTFGLGFSFSAKGAAGSDGDDRNFQQFPDSSKKEPMFPIQDGTMTVKLNVNQTQPLPSDGYYEHTITFLAIPDF